MLVMPTNNTGFESGVLFGRFPNRLAHLHNPTRLFEPKHGISWALDNGVYGAWSGDREWEEGPFYRYLKKFADSHRPKWVAVPDAVTDRETTLEMWKIHAKKIKAYKVPLAFVVQDGMTPADVPEEPEPAVIFVGGSTSFKWRTLRPLWIKNFSRVHVGRVNTERHLWQAHEAGAESCDGTGWFRGGSKRLSGLIRYLEQSTAGDHPQLKLIPHED